VAPVLVLAALGGVSVVYPQLLGNGKNTVQLAITGGLGLGLLAVLVVLKPLFTAACLSSGAPGGLFTPTLTFGVLFGGAVGHLWSLVWPGSPAGSYALIGGAAVLAASMQGPLAATVMMLELAHHSETLLVPMLLAVAGATTVSRVVGAPSIYSARLGEDAARRDRPERGQQRRAR
jgi:H+/Cl- antiporter ClcA